MAVTCTLKRNSHTDDVATSVEFCTATLSGTYATGGFTVNPFAVSAGAGTSPLPGSIVRDVQWRSPLGYTYVSTTAGTVMTTKIFSAANTELANLAAVPDTSVPVVLIKSKQ